MSTSNDWETDIEGNFPVHKAVSQALPKGTKIISAATWGASAWTKTAKLCVILEDGREERYFLKCASGKGARALAEGEYHSAVTIRDVVQDFGPKPISLGQYHNGKTEVYFFVSSFHGIDLAAVPDPVEFTTKLAELHSRGILERTVAWEESWAKSFTNQLQDMIGYDNDANGHWPQLDAACKQLIDAVIPRLLGVLQSGGRNIEPALVHGDLWEQNVGIDMETGKLIIFDPGCTYAHNEMEFGTWRCSWAHRFNSSQYRRLYQRHIEPSEPAEEWGDRNRLYSIHAYLVDSADHPGSPSRQI